MPRPYSLAQDCVASQPLVSTPPDTDVVGIYECRLSLKDLSTFGKYQCKNKRKQGVMKYYMWTQTKPKGRKLNRSIFDYFGVLLSNKSTKYLGFFENTMELAAVLEGMEAREIDEIDEYKTIFCFVNFKSSGNGICSFVMDVNEPYIGKSKYDLPRTAK